MANTLITPSENETETAAERQSSRAAFARNLSQQPSAPSFGSSLNLGQPTELRSSNPFQSMIQNVRDAFFPEKLPPLVLESKPIAVVDPMAVKRDPVSTGIAVGFHALALLLVIWISAIALKKVVAPPKEVAKNISFDVPPPPPPIVHTPVIQQSGGGGGQHDIAPVSKGAPPKISPVQILAPTAPPKIQPKLAVVPTVDLDHPMAKSSLPDLGNPNAPNVGSSMGMGNGAGLGSGNGNGVGPGNGRGTGGGDYRPGVNGVSFPKLVYQVDPEFSEEARKAKFQGEVLVQVIVDANGKPTAIRIPRPIGMGLDEKAREAVAQYRFKPAMKDGKPVPVPVNVEVNFQIF